MTIVDRIRRMFVPRRSVISDQRASAVFNGFDTVCRQYANLIWYNICDLLTDLAEDVKIEAVDGNTDVYKFVAFKTFFYAWGKTVLQTLFDKGYIVIGYDGIRYWIMDANEYTTSSANGLTYAQPIDNRVEVYVMRSACYLSRQMSDKQLCRGMLEFLDDVLNSSATISKRMGAVVIASPKNLSSAPTSVVLTDEQKKRIEKEMRDDYGSLNKQSNIMLLPREMSFQVVNLAGLDLKTLDKAKLAILAICDRIKVPANQVAIVDANSSKTLANGGELREGDKAKYKTFRRLFERTFVQMAMDLQIKMRYTIDGEPLDEVAADLIK